LRIANQIPDSDKPGPNLGLIRHHGIDSKSEQKGFESEVTMPQ